MAARGNAVRGSAASGAYASQRYLGAVLVSSDRVTLGMIQTAKPSDGRLAIDVALNPTLGLGSRNVSLALETQGRPGPRIRLDMTANQFTRLIGGNN
ncbi:hypothetical protein [Acidimangrovimonas sediminis]|uniref:hypothetical protein n=1 Tax=Acidimangrovimonas sediminis TaxID=2056283 RepID=UPI000C80FF8E|nr:hypothetical protein [Acidimangrovimonas sediminis]